jgi:gliding motility-associated-like protein
MNTIKCKIITLILFFFVLQSLSAQNNDTCLAFIPPETIEGINMTSVLKGEPGSIIQFDNEYYDPDRWGTFWVASCNPYKQHTWNTEGYFSSGGMNGEISISFSKPIFNFIFASGAMNWGEKMIIITNDTNSKIVPIDSCDCKLVGDTLKVRYTQKDKQWGAGGCGKWKITSSTGFTSAKFRLISDDSRGINAGSGFCLTFCKCNFREFRTVRKSQKIRICFDDSVKVGNKNHKQPGKYIDTLLGSYGYDSIVTTTVTVDYKKVDIINLTKCSFDKVVIAGKTYKTGGNYRDTIRSKNKCDSQIYVINILDSSCNFNIYIPDAFTPNSEGPEQNNIFLPYSENVRTFRMTIYNRWGGKVYETSNSSLGWDGTYMGKIAKKGVYVYLIETETHSGQKYQYRGVISLIM